MLEAVAVDVCDGVLVTDSAEGVVYRFAESGAEGELVSTLSGGELPVLTRGTEGAGFSDDVFYVGGEWGVLKGLEIER